MNTYAFSLGGQRMVARPSGALWLPDARALCVSDLHLGKSDRIARRLGLMLPPYEVAATLDRLSVDLDATDPAVVICLGDSFDDLSAAASLTEDDRLRLLALQAGRRWIWVAGNHDPGPIDIGGSHLADWRCGDLVFRHIARPGATAEVSGHFHPKLGLPGLGAARPCFLIDTHRAVLPAYGTYTGGLRATDPALRGLLAPRALAVLTGPRCLPVPLPPLPPPPGPPPPGQTPARAAVARPGARPGRAWRPL